MGTSLALVTGFRWRERRVFAALMTGIRCANGFPLRGMGVTRFARVGYSLREWASAPRNRYLAEPKKKRLRTLSRFNLFKNKNLLVICSRQSRDLLSFVTCHLSLVICHLSLLFNSRQGACYSLVLFQLDLY